MNINKQFFIILFFSYNALNSMELTTSHYKPFKKPSSERQLYLNDAYEYGLEEASHRLKNIPKKLTLEIEEQELREYIHRHRTYKGYTPLMIAARNNNYDNTCLYLQYNLLDKTLAPYTSSSVQ